MPCDETARSELGELAAALAGFRYRYQDEAELQAGLAEVLGRGPRLSQVIGRVDREHRLDARSRIDFLVTSRSGRRYGVEVKMQGSPTALRRQLWRYAEFPAVEGLLLVCGRRALLAGIEGRSEVLDKPFLVVETWEGLL